MISRWLPLLMILSFCALPAQPQALASDPPHASEIQLPWELIQRQTLDRLPRSGVFSAAQLRFEWSRWAPQKDSEHLRLQVSGSEFKVAPLKLDLTQKTQSQGLHLTLGKPRQSGPPLLFGRGERSDVVRLSYRPSDISIEQLGDTRITLEQLGVLHEFGEAELKGISVTVSGIQLELRSALEAQLDAAIELNSDGIPQLKDAKPEIKLDPSRVHLPCDQIQIQMEGISTGQIQTRPGLIQKLKTKICDYLKANQEALLNEHTQKVHELLQQKIMPDLLKSANEQIRIHGEEQLKKAVELTIVGLAAAGEGIRIGFGPRGQDCAFDPQLPLHSLRSDEALLSLGERDSNHLLSELLKDPQRRKFDVPGLGTLLLSEVPKINMFHPGRGEDAGSFDINVQGELTLPDGKSMIPGYPSLVEPPLQAKGTLRVRPVLKNGVLTLELLRDLQLNLNDMSGKAVQLKQDRKGGSLSMPDSTLQSIAENWLSDTSRPAGKTQTQFSIQQASAAIVDSRTQGLSSLRITPDGRVLTADGKSVVGRIDKNGAVLDPRGNLIPHLKTTEVRNVWIAGKPMRLLGTPKLSLGKDGRIEAEIQVDVDAKTHAQVAWVDDFLMEPTYVSEKGKAVEDQKPLDHITATVRGVVQVQAKDDQLVLMFDEIKPIGRRHTNIDLNQKTWTGAGAGVLVDVSGWLHKKLNGIQVPVSGTEALTQGILEQTRKSIEGMIKNGGKPLFTQQVSAIPGWSEFAARHGQSVKLAGFRTDSGTLKLDYQFTDSERPGVILVESTDSDLMTKALGAASRLPELAHIREAQIKTDPYSGEPRFEVRVAEGPSPWRTQKEFHSLPELSENQPH